jgi:3-hydroxyethyl bacteriochlorophyllide a dehydrogenase
VDTIAVVFDEPGQLSLRTLALTEPSDADVVVDVEYSGISTGTERLLYTGRMPPFPGLGYPLVPGYESVGRVAHAGARSGRRVGERVFIPGARCYADARSLFGGSARTLVVPGAKAYPFADALADRGTLFALAATAHHAIAGATLPDLIVGHGVLGRLLARLACALHPDAAPVVWETNPDRAGGADGYAVLHPDDDPRRDYRAVYDVSGAEGIVDTLVGRLAPRGEIVLAGFYDTVAFRFPPAFQKEARLRIAAEFTDADLVAVTGLASAGILALDDLITHRTPATRAADAYPTAFGDARCVKMILDWREVA